MFAHVLVTEQGWPSDGNFRARVLSIYYMGVGGRTRVTRLGGRHLHLLNYLGSFLKIDQTGEIDKVLAMQTRRPGTYGKNWARGHMFVIPMTKCGEK